MRMKPNTHWPKAGQAPVIVMFQVLNRLESINRHNTVPIFNTSCNGIMWRQSSSIPYAKQPAQADAAYRLRAPSTARKIIFRLALRSYIQLLVNFRGQALVHQFLWTATLCGSRSRRSYWVCWPE